MLQVDGFPGPGRVIEHVLSFKSSKQARKAANSDVISTTQASKLQTEITHPENRYLEEKTSCVKLYKKFLTVHKQIILRKFFQNKKKQQKLILIFQALVELTNE